MPGMMEQEGPGVPEDAPSLALQAHSEPLFAISPHAVTSFKSFASRRFSFIMYSVDGCCFGTV